MVTLHACIFLTVILNALEQLLKLLSYSYSVTEILNDEELLYEVSLLLTTC